MKNILTETRLFVLLAFFMLILNGCSNLLYEEIGNSSDGKNSVTEIPEGFGTVRVSLSQGADEARSPIPALVLGNVFLEYKFAKGDSDPEGKAPDYGDNEFILEPGNYTLKVKAFIDEEKTKLAAEGECEFEIETGIAAETELTLHPIVEGEGAGELEFSLEYPNGGTVETFNLTLIAGGGSPIDLKQGGAVSGTDTLTFSGTNTNIPVGYYLLRVVVGQ